MGGFVWGLVEWSRARAMIERCLDGLMNVALELRNGLLVMFRDIEVRFRVLNQI